ncbi:hypothetical protein PRIC1_007386 [Phytophthora ramorum]
MEVQARASRPPLTIVTNLSQQAKAKYVNAAVFPHSTIDSGLVKPRTLSTSSTCVISPSSSSAASAAPPAPVAILNTNKQKTLTPTASSRSRNYKYCSDPDCISPMATDVVSSRTAEPTTAKSATTPVASGPHVSTMSSDTYFKLLKKSQVLEHLVQLSSHVGDSEQRVRRLQCEQARAQCVQDRVFAELERYRRQVVDAQQQFLGLIEELTALCMREEQVQVDNADDQEEPAAVTAEEQTLQDLQRASSPTAKVSSTSSAPGSTIETQALAIVGRLRVQQLEAICARYERQLVGSEAALSQAIFSDAARESAAKIAQLEACNQQHEADKQALQVQLELARGQAAHLQEQLAETKERRTTLEHVRTLVSTRLGKYLLLTT